jgi:predicted TIM-barrel fold metal-dependent hydrolase
MCLVDTHQHFWDRDRLPYSWTKGVPPLNRSFGLEEYKEAARQANVAKTLFMECDADRPHALDEARWVQELAEADPLIAGIIAGAYLDDPDFPAHLAALRELSKVRGIRQVLHTQPDDFSRQPLFRDHLRSLAETGLTFDLCALARQLPIVAEAVEACPKVTFVLDHCGIPDIASGGLEPWKESISRLAELPQVAACKVSGIVAYAKAYTWTVDDLRPYFDHVIATFGWDRVVWGGDWPVCLVSAELQSWVEALHELTKDASEAEKAALFHRNAERIYRV